MVGMEGGIKGGFISPSCMPFFFPLRETRGGCRWPVRPFFSLCSGDDDVSTTTGPIAHGTG